MAKTNFVIQHKHSITKGQKPSSLAAGEIAINAAAGDEKIYIKNSNNEIVAIGENNKDDEYTNHIVAFDDKGACEYYTDSVEIGTVDGIGGHSVSIAAANEEQAGVMSSDDKRLTEDYKSMRNYYIFARTSTGKVVTTGEDVTIGDVESATDLDETNPIPVVIPKASGLKAGVMSAQDKALLDYYEGVRSNYLVLGSESGELDYMEDRVVLGNTEFGNLDDLEVNEVNIELASTDRVGLLRRLPGNATLFLNGEGEWATPTSGGGGGDLTANDRTLLDWLSSNKNNINVGLASATNIGGAKLATDAKQQTTRPVTSTANRTYACQLNTNNQLVVNVPWIDTIGDDTVDHTIVIDASKLTYNAVDLTTIIYNIDGYTLTEDEGIKKYNEILDSFQNDYLYRHRLHLTLICDTLTYYEVISDNDPNVNTSSIYYSPLSGMSIKIYLDDYDVLKCCQIVSTMSTNIVLNIINNIIPIENYSLRLSDLYEQRALTFNDLGTREKENSKTILNFINNSWSISLCSRIMFVYDEDIFTLSYYSDDEAHYASPNSDNIFMLVDDADGVIITQTFANKEIEVPKATTSKIGGFKLWSSSLQTVVPSAITSTMNRTYAVQLDEEDRLMVNVPWVEPKEYVAATRFKEGLIPKLSGNATQFLNGKGEWSTPTSEDDGGNLTTDDRVLLDWLSTYKSDMVLNADGSAWPDATTVTIGYQSINGNNSQIIIGAAQSDRAGVMTANDKRVVDWVSSNKNNLATINYVKNISMYGSPNDDYYTLTLEDRNDNQDGAVVDIPLATNNFAGLMSPEDRTFLDKMKSQEPISIWTGTQAQYNAITTKNNNTIYLIV